MNVTIRNVLLKGFGVLVASLISAVLASMATYYLFDPQMKPYDQRGVLTPVFGEVWDTGMVGSAPMPGTEEPKETNEYPDPWIDADITLVNIGKQPIKSIEIYVTRPNNAIYLPLVTSKERLIEKPRMSGQHAIFSVAGAVAPKGYFTLHINVPVGSNVIAITEHGDSTQLLAPDMSKFIKRKTKRVKVEAQPIGPPDAAR